jgi:CspA family cold shock protein|tara:strand:- start:3462 stop:3878 length:417 start_codon:yes stop_codon:yes gene_type:complete
MDIALLLLRNLIISVFIALVAVISGHLIDRGNLGLPFVSEDYGLLLQFTVAVFVGALLLQLTDNLFASRGSRELGTVKWFNVKKGYGFITRDQGEDVFVHFRNIRGSGRRSISEGQRVEFVVISGKKGLQADDVHTSE